MSRYCVTLERGSVAYGFDHALGYFYTRYDGEGEVVEDHDTLFSGLTHGKLLGLLEGVPIPEEHRSLIALDLPV